MKLTDSTKITLSFGQIKRLITEASKFDPEFVEDGNKLVNEAIRELQKTTDSIEKVQEMQNLLKMFSADAIEKARQAKAAKSAAMRLVKRDSDPLDNAAKRLAEIINTDEDVFFSARKAGRKVGIILTTVKKIISQDDSNMAILERLQDPDFIRKNEKLRGVSEKMLAILEEARDQLNEIGFFDRGEEQFVRKAQGLYSLEDDEFTPLKEDNFFSNVGKSIVSMVKKAGIWLQRFLPKFERQQKRYVSELQDWEDYITDFGKDLL